MNRIVILLLFGLFVVVIILPAAIIEFFRLPEPPVSIQTGGPMVRLLVTAENRVRELPLEEYLVGVLAAEMPAEFEQEALKAQVVAARTYTLKKMEVARQTPNPHHPGADVCDDPSHCQGWFSTGDMERVWGPWRYFGYRDKMQTTVTSTRGLAITYRGELIDPVYHSNAGGRTENSEDVWQFKIPYLRGVDSRWDKDSPRYQAVATIPLVQVDKALGTTLNTRPATALRGSSPQILGVTKYSPNGRVKQAVIDGKTFTGNDLRRLLNLASTNLLWKIEGASLVITTLGNGHGVGMSQYGANGMAKEGYQFADILIHYYTGVEVIKY